MLVLAVSCYNVIGKNSAIHEIPSNQDFAML